MAAVSARALQLSLELDLTVPTHHTQDLGIATEAVFAAFVQGFNSAHPMFLMSDVGPQKEAADAKFRETLKMYSKLPQCKLILAGCEHDGG